MPAEVLTATIGGVPRGVRLGKESRLTVLGPMAAPIASRVDDSWLIRNAQRGDVAAFEELVRQYDRPVLRLALHLTGSEADAQDIYQEAFLKAYRNLGGFRFECSFYTWLYRIVTNLCLDYLRKRRSRKEDGPAAVTPEGEEIDVLHQVMDERAGANPERDLLRRELGQRIQDSLELLSPRERLVFELRHYHGLRLRTVGELLSTSEETAKNTLFRATRKMRAALADLKESQVTSHKSQVTSNKLNTEKSCIYRA